MQGLHGHANLALAWVGSCLPFILPCILLSNPDLCSPSPTSIFPKLIYMLFGQLVYMFANPISMLLQPTLVLLPPTSVQLNFNSHVCPFLTSYTCAAAGCRCSGPTPLLSSPSGQVERVLGRNNPPALPAPQHPVQVSDSNLARLRDQKRVWRNCPVTNVLMHCWLS